MPAQDMDAREGYRQALAAERRSRGKTQSAGEPFADYWIGRLEFRIGYFDCIEVTRRATTLEAAATIAKKDGNPKLAKRKHAGVIEAMQQALSISRSMLESYARVARDQSDRGAIATMAEYVYRPLKEKVDKLKSTQQP